MLVRYQNKQVNFCHVDEYTLTDANLVAICQNVNALSSEGILDPLDILEDATMDLALKMMFNYEIESDSEALVYAMRNETVPAQLSTDTETKFLSRCAVIR